LAHSDMAFFTVRDVCVVHDVHDVHKYGRCCGVDLTVGRLQVELTETLGTQWNQLEYWIGTRWSILKHWHTAEANEKLGPLLRQLNIGRTPCSQ
jgi:hypothetical protein